MSYFALRAISGSCQNVVCAWISPCRDSGSLQTLSETLLVGMEIVLRIERISKETANDKSQSVYSKKRSTLMPVCRALRDEKKRAAPIRLLAKKFCRPEMSGTQNLKQ